ncbi:uncharacterized protein BO96DRAFT_76596 [Aspergillus niger CBS 101883]|uniref:uncharacterized protein n=1 Tax=Aspergillus lacticoffeatus (strain CBS 101883) TaxID=1450533 RepID=UPI000D7F256C|nr:uncharacterized protein BO96DRAFT_76596 [Aspergillus niger CBS 101883]PYH55490.1 hypothetical protein BO96DRAFT_76596 [Aspergillus niger CBS 101883]
MSPNPELEKKSICPCGVKQQQQPGVIGQASSHSAVIGYWFFFFFSFLFHPRLNRRRPSRPPVSAATPLPVTNANWDPRCIVNNQSCYYAVLFIIVIITHSAAMVRLFASHIDQLLL